MTYNVFSGTLNPTHSLTASESNGFEIRNTNLTEAAFSRLRHIPIAFTALNLAGL